MVKTAKIVENAIDVIELMANSKETGVTELSVALNLSKSTIHRILVALSNKGFVTQNIRTRRYNLGLEFIKIAGLAITKMDLETIVRPYLERLRDRFKETAVIGLRTGWMYTYIAECPSLMEHAVIPLLGSQSPLHTSAFGGVILAFLREAEIEEFLNSGPLVRLTDKTITDPDVLKQELVRIHNQGYAITRGQRLRGSIGITVPIFDRSGSAVASIGIVGPDMRVETMDLNEVTRQLVNDGKEISSVLQISSDYGVLQIGKG